MNPKKPFTILVIEDDLFMLDAIRIILESEGYHVIQAENGKKALDILKQDLKPDLILLDMIMPVMNGWDFASAYKQTYENRCPIVVITGASDVAQRAKDIGADAWLSKPYEIEDIIQMVHKFVQ